MKPPHIKKVGDSIITTNKKLNYPNAIKGVALITSKESEGYNDFLHTLTANDFGYKFHLFPLLSKVQAEKVAAEIVESLKRLYTNYLPCQ